MVELEGERIDLQELTVLNVLPDLHIEEHDERYYLRSEEFTAIDDARGVLARGTEILRVINGIAHFKIENWEPVRAVRIARDEPNGPAHSSYWQRVLE